MLVYRIYKTETISHLIMNFLTYNADIPWVFVHPTIVTDYHCYWELPLCIPPMFSYENSWLLRNILRFG